MNFMKFAIEEAKKSDNDIPVGAVVVYNGEIIASAHNEREKLNDISAHAEILALKKASKVLNNWRLDDCEIYVTLEPCPMCGWAILQSRVKSVYFGSYDMNYGSFTSKIDLRTLSSNKINIYGGIEEQECESLLKIFFKNIRG